jgi:hypothetical protein
MHGTLNSTDTTLKQALRYLGRGWSVIPIAFADKRPLVRWRDFQTRRAHAAEMSNWLQRWPTANLAIVTGAVSGIVVLDIDPRHGGEAGLAALERDIGPFPSTLSALSGGGGRHLYFRHPGHPVRNQCGLRQGVDLRGDGGYIVAPPSMHASGKRYRWLCTSAESSPALLPKALTARAGKAKARSFAQWRDLVRGGVDAGARNDSIASLAGHLLRRGVDPGVVLELLLSWNKSRCRPPLTDAEVVRTLDSIQRARLRQAQACDQP